jgi:hypothetical protein
MRIIIAGSRNITNYQVIQQAIEESKFNITQIVSGGAKGVDKLGEKYANNNNISCAVMNAQWKDISVEGAIVRENSYGFYNAKAGMIRNKKMAQYADALIAIWDGKSTGTKNMIEEMKKLNKPVYIKIINE